MGLTIQCNSHLITLVFLFDPLRADPARRRITAMVQAETGESYTYGEVEENVLRLSAGLRALGVQRGVVVEIFGPASDVAIPQLAYGILHAGYASLNSCFLDDVRLWGRCGNIAHGSGSY